MKIYVLRMNKSLQFQVSGKIKQERTDIKLFIIIKRQFYQSFVFYITRIFDFIELFYFFKLITITFTNSL